MARSLNKLSAAAVKHSTAGKYSDGGGLWLFKREDGGGQWVLRITVHGRRREMGLGAISEVSLKEAREEAERWRAVVRTGRDPIKERERSKRESAKRLHLLKDIAEDAYESRKAELKGDGKAGRWYSPLELHIIPKLGKVPVAEVDPTMLRDTLCQDLWRETAHGALSGTIADVWADERAALMSLPAMFDGFVEQSKRVSPTCLITFERNRYSVPASFANRPVWTQFRL